MRRIAAMDRAKPDPPGIRRQTSPVDRIVLKHQQRVEQLAKPRKLLDLRQPDMLVRHRP